MSEDERPDNPTAHDATSRTADASAMLVAPGRDGGRAVAANGHASPVTPPSQAKRPTPPPPGYTREPPLEPLEPRTRTRLKKLRLFAILVAMLLLGLVSFAFGMFMAVASDLPKLENSTEFNNASNSVLLDDHGNQLAILNQQHRILLKQGQVPQPVIDAVISVEDKRFYHSSGIDIRGIGRAVLADLLHGGAVQGASTIEQQFVKNVLQAQSHRTIFEKLREAALAYHLSHRWPKNKIITEYLNTIYFGNGAYGIESAAQTYFGHMPGYIGCGALNDLCVTQLQYHPADEALLAGLIASPSGYDPGGASDARAGAAHRGAQRHARPGLHKPHAVRRGDRDATADGVRRPGTGADDRGRLQHRLLRRLGAGAGHRPLRRAARVRGRAEDHDIARPAAAEGRRGRDQRLPAQPHRAVGGARGDRQRHRTGQGDGRRAQLRREPVQPRHAGRAPARIGVQGVRPRRGARQGHLPLLGVALPSADAARSARRASSSCATTSPPTPARIRSPATALSDNTVFAQVGVKVGTHRIAGLAHRMGITTPDLDQLRDDDRRPLHRRHGARHGARLRDDRRGRPARERLARGRRPAELLRPGRHRRRCTSPTATSRSTRRCTAACCRHRVASTETSMLETVITSGTGTNAAIGGFAAGKTGTTSNYADAWFVGWNNKYTVAVWVGYPNKLVPMTTDFGGSPVLGGTFPALIWHDFMLSAMSIAANQSTSGATSCRSRHRPASPAGEAERRRRARPRRPARRPSPAVTARRAPTAGRRDRRRNEQRTPAPASPAATSPASGGGQATGGGQGTAAPDDPGAERAGPGRHRPPHRLRRRRRQQRRPAQRRQRGPAGMTPGARAYR